MAEITLKGIDRSNSNENAIPEAASLILNARKKGSTWEYVGDKEHVGYFSQGSNDINGYLKFFWHYKIKGYYEIGSLWTDESGYKIKDDAHFHKEDMLIAYIHEPPVGLCPARKIIGIFYLSKVNSANYVDDFRDTNRQDSFYLKDDEEFLSLHSLNDIVILDTDKNKYYFAWDEAMYSFVLLPEITNFEISVSSIESNIDGKKIIQDNDISVSADTFPYSVLESMAMEDDIDREASLSLKNALLPLIKMFFGSLKGEASNLGLFFKGFRIVAAIELVDGSILKLSNIVDFIDNIYNAKNRQKESFNFQHFLHADNKSAGIYTVSLQKTGVMYNNSGDRDDIFNALYGNTNIDTKFKAYSSLKVNFNNKHIDKLKAWIRSDLVKCISIYITEPNDFLDFENIHPVVGRIEGNFHGNIITYIPYKNDKAYDVNVPFYKIGEFDINEDKTSFEFKPEYLRDIITKKSLLVEQDLSKIYTSKSNTVYNAMVHKSSVKNIIKTENLMFGRIDYWKDPLIQLDVCVDFKIKDKWYRSQIGYWSDLNVFSINSVRLEFFTLDIKEANLVIRTGSSFRIFKKLTLKKSTFTNSIIVYLQQYSNYRNANIKEHEAVVRGITFTEFSIPQKGAYMYVLISAPEISSLPLATYTISQGDLIYDDTNRLQLSATENPFIYPSVRSYRFGNSNNKVITCETSTVGMSDTKFGMLPLYVFTNEGVWIMETADGDIAYNSRHLLENINCFDNPKLVHRVLGGVIFAAADGLYVVGGTNITKISSRLEGRVVLQDIDGIKRRILGLPDGSPMPMDDDYVFSLSNAAVRRDNLMKDYFTEDSFCVHDKIENELLFIEPSKDFSYVLMLNDMSWAMRKDIYDISGVAYKSFTDFVEANNDYLLIKKCIDKSYPQLNTYRFYKLNETKALKSGIYINNNAIVFVSGVVMFNQYMKIEHIISRFSQFTDTEFDSHIFLIGSRDGIEWKVLNHSYSKFPKSMSGQQMRRCFTSARYFQFVYMSIERGQQSTSSRKDNYFERFTFDMSNSDAEGKMR